MYIANCSHILLAMTVEELKKIVGGNLKKERIRRNLTQSALAEHADLSIKQIAAIETGHSYPEGQTLVKLSNALNVPPSFFYKSKADEKAEQERLIEHFKNIESKFGMMLRDEVSDYIGREN